MNNNKPEDDHNGTKPLGGSQQLDDALLRELLKLEAERNERRNNETLRRMFRGIGNAKPTKGNAL